MKRQTRQRWEPVAAHPDLPPAAYTTVTDVGTARIERHPHGGWQAVLSTPARVLRHPAVGEAAHRSVRACQLWVEHEVTRLGG